MYKASARDLIGSLVDAFVYHPYSDAFRMARLKLWYWRHFNRRRYAQLKKINLGCGPNIVEGFCNIDVSGPADFHFNFLNRFPIADNLVDLVYCEHTLEHFHIDHVQHVIREVHRILAPGGVLRISVPKVSSPSDRPAGVRVWRMDEIQGADLVELNRRIFSHEHKALFSVPMVEHLLLAAGFKRVSPTREQESVFADTDLIRRIEHRRVGNVVVEAHKD